jgi:hypothetical protein
MGAHLVKWCQLEETTQQLGSYIHVGLYFTSFVGAEVTPAPTNMPSPFSHFGVVGWTLTQVSLGGWCGFLKKKSFPLLTPPWPTHPIMTSPTYQSPTYLFPCALPPCPCCTCLMRRWCFVILVNKLATPCSLMLLHCFFFFFPPWQAMCGKFFFSKKHFLFVFCFLTIL